jgi:hypothetical protein
MQRRIFLKTSAGIVGGVLSGGVFSGHISVAQEQTIPGTKDFRVPLKQVTHGPGYHWFGYYDKLQFDPTSRFALGMRTQVDKRTPMPDDVLEIGLIDLDDACRWTKLGESRAWSWQQGCMLQWVPGSKTDVIWNDREGDRYVSRIANVTTGNLRTLPKAVYALSPDGKYAVGTEFSRINALRPGYGYVGLEDPYFEVKAPEEIGIYRLNLETGDDTLIASLGKLAKIPHNGEDVSDNFHWFNHLLVNTDGTRLTFLHRWRKERTDRQEMARRGWTTRMFTLGMDGSDPYIINSSGFVSHFVWADAKQIAAFVKADGKLWKLYLLEGRTGQLTPVGHEKIETDGHNTYIPGTDNRWILNDTYPQGKERLQTLYLYDSLHDRRIDLGRFYEPPEFVGEWRVDLHARTSPNGQRIIVDSTHTGERQMWLLDMSNFDYKE